MCPELRPLLRGLSRGDSLTLDPHKGMFLPYGTGALLVRDGNALREVHTATAGYLPENQDEFYDPAQYGPELSRGFPGLRVWLSVKLYGAARYRAAISEKRSLALWAAWHIALIPGIVMDAAPQLSLFAFHLEGAALTTQDKRNAATAELVRRVTARGRVMLYAKQNKPLEPGWAFDERGVPTTDPHAALKGLLAPIGGYKGYGISLAIDLLCGVLTGSSYGSHFPGFLADNLKDPTDVGSVFVAINVESFMDLPEFKASMDTALQEMKSSERAEGVKRIYIPGEIELETKADRLKHGIPIPEAVVTDFIALGQELGVPFPQA